jgi:DNA-binding response OmpR family regulator
MKILLADDDFDLRLALGAILPRWGFEVVHAGDGVEAWQALQGPDAPHLAILDWVMPGLDGLEVCRLARDHPDTARTYILLLTARREKEDLVTGLVGGADDYLVKPVEPEELRGRLHAARRIVELQEQLTARVREHQDALARVRELQALLPVCRCCKKIRDDRDYWHRVEAYVAALPETPFGEGVCPDCLAKVVLPEIRQRGASPV